jgi:hypothetical protein
MAEKAKAPNAKPTRRARPERKDTEMEESLHRYFGTTEGSDFERLVPRLSEQSDAIQSWLAASRENSGAFERDPVATLRKNFPDLKIPATASSEHRIALGDSIRIGGKAPAGPDPAVLVLFVAVWNYLGDSAANVAEFRANPVGVITSLGQGQEPSVVSEVMKAFGVSPNDAFSFGRLVDEAVLSGVLDPSGPVEATVVGEIAVLNETATIRAR